MKLFLAGEGSDELGEWFHYPSYRDKNRGLGVIEALLKRLSPDGWTVKEGIAWKNIRKYRAGKHRGAETRNVLGAALAAIEAGCDALVFMRDQDGDSDREQDLQRGIEDAESLFPELRMCGGLAVQELEAWILALKGMRRSEDIKDAKQHLLKEHQIETREEMVACIESSDLDALPADAISLARWRDAARRLLA